MICQLSQIPLKFSKKQVQFIRSRTFIRGFVAGRGSGKSYVGAATVLQSARAGEPWMSVSPSYGMVHETTLPTFLDLAKETNQFIRLVKSPVPRITFRTVDHGTADLVFRSGEEPERLRGPSKAGLWIDEASICKPDVFKIGIATLRYKGKMGPVILTFTPRGRRHWTFETFYQRVEAGAEGHYTVLDGVRHWVAHDLETGAYYEPLPVKEFSGLQYVRTYNTELVQAHTLDNPFLPREFHDNIRQHYSTHLATQELAGEFVDIEGLMFKREWFEMVDDVPVDAMRVRYWDRAATPLGGDYSAGVLMARTRSGQFYVEHVIRGRWSAQQRDKIIQQTAEADARKYGNTVFIFVEQEGGSGGKEVAQQAVVNLARFPIHVDKVTGKRKRSQDHQNLPGEAKVVRALPLQSQAENGRVWIKRGDWNEDFLEELCVSRNTRILTSRGWVVITDIQPGHSVWTRSGLRKVRRCERTSHRAITGTITTATGLTLTSTPRHPVYVEGKGFVPAARVRVGDVLVCCSPDAGITTTRTATGQTSGIISSAVCGELSAICTAISTSPPGVPWTPDSACITATATRTTTASRTSAVSHEQNTIPPMPWDPSVPQSARLSASGAARSIAPPGRAATPAVNRAVSPCAGAKEKASPNTLACAKSAEKRSPHGIRRPGLVRDVVVAPWSGGHVEEVWNLEIEGQHEYFADGILTHNCAFPEYTHDDQVDAAAGATNKLASLTGIVGAHVTRTEVEAKKVAATKFGVHLNESANRRLRTRGERYD